MQAFQHFSENECEYLLYQQRLDAERVENTWKHEIARLAREVEQAEHRAEQAQHRAEQARHREELARHREERLIALLKQAGINPEETI